MPTNLPERNNVLSPEELVGLVAFTIVVIMYRAFILSYLWLWFIVPLGAPRLGLFQTTGVLLIAGYVLTPAVTPQEGPAEKVSVARVTKVVLEPLVFLGIGLIIKQFL